MSKKVSIPLELKLDYLERAYRSLFKGVLYAIREKYGAAEAIDIFERLWKMDDRVKNLTNILIKIFKLERNDAETMAKWYEIWHELNGFEYTWLERSKTIARYKVTQCPFKPAYKDLSDFCLIYANIVNKTINQKATVERLKGMCAGDSYCEFIHRVEECG